MIRYLTTVASLTLAVGLIAAVTSLECYFRTGKWLEGKEPTPQPVPLEFYPNAAFNWKYFGRPERDVPMNRSIPIMMEDGETRAILKYPVGDITLYRYQGDLYGEYEGYVFRLNEDDLPVLPNQNDSSLYLTSIFDRFGGHAPGRQVHLPLGYKAEYTARVSDMPFWRGCAIPEPFTAGNVQLILDAGANMLYLKPGDNLSGRLAEIDPSIPVVIDCRYLPDGDLYDIVRAVAGRRQVRAFDLGGGTGIHERAMRVRQLAPEAIVIVSPDIFGTPSGFEGFQPLPLTDVLYAVQFRKDDLKMFELFDTVHYFQREYGARIFVRQFSVRQPETFLNLAEKNQWLWCATFPPATLETNLFKRNLAHKYH